METELKPCPFCGGEIEFIPSHVEEQNFVNSASIICRKCRNEYVGATFIVPGEIESEELTNNILINWWNTRPAEDALKAEVERLKSTIEKVKKELITHRDHAIQSINHNGKTYQMMNQFLMLFCNNLIEMLNSDTSTPEKGVEDELS